MKLHSLCVLLIPLALAAAGDKVPARKAKCKPPAPAAATIPKGAVEFEPNLFRYKDEKGKVWIYHKTPFGVMKAEETKRGGGQVIPEGMTAVEDGDSIRFERPSPFGGSVRWSRKKTDLTELEQAAWEQEQRKAKAEGGK